jgi:hypothetical protein
VSLVCKCGHAAEDHYLGNCMRDRTDGSLRYRDWQDRCKCTVVEPQIPEDYYRNWLSARGLEDTPELRDAYTTGYEWGYNDAS